jgi:hypothetical protein
MRNVWLRSTGLQSALLLRAPLLCVVLALAAASAVNANAQAPQTPSAAAHLKHRYSFSSDAGDSVGDAAGKLQGAALVKDGKLVLDGSAGSYVDLPGGLLSGYKAATIEFWISTGQNGNYARVFDAGEISGRSGIQSIYFCVDHTATGDWRLKISVPDGKDQVVAIKGNLSNRKDLHVVNVLDPATGFMGIYVNGELVGSRTDLNLACGCFAALLLYRAVFVCGGCISECVDRRVSHLRQCIERRAGEEGLLRRAGSGAVGEFLPRTHPLR